MFLSGKYTASCKDVGMVLPGTNWLWHDNITHIKTAPIQYDCISPLVTYEGSAI